jgi:hypothetical protein
MCIADAGVMSAILVNVGGGVPAGRSDGWGPAVPGASGRLSPLETGYRRTAPEPRALLVWVAARIELDASWILSSLCC